jgi:F-type H+-transporting ATPase subunit delta
VRVAGEVPELHELLRNPQVDRRAKANALVRNFMRLLAEKGRAGEVDEIAREYERLVAREQGRLEVELTTAIELSEDDAKAIVGQIEKASGKKVEATRKVDPELIGGLILQVGSRMVDASVRGRFERLRHELTTARS